MVRFPIMRLSRVRLHFARNIPRKDRLASIVHADQDLTPARFYVRIVNIKS